MENKIIDSKEGDLMPEELMVDTWPPKDDAVIELKLTAKEIRLIVQSISKEDCERYSELYAKLRKLVY